MTALLSADIEAYITHFEGPVFRAVVPLFQNQPYSGYGASLYGGRFNPKGCHALYTSVSYETSLLEVVQGFATKLRPKTIYRMDVLCSRLLDLTDNKVISGVGLDEDVLSAAWNTPSSFDFVLNELTASNARLLPDCQRMYFELINARVHAIKVPSFAPGAGNDDNNIVFVNWNKSDECRLLVYDPENELGAFQTDSSPFLRQDYIDFYTNL